MMLATWSVQDRLPYLLAPEGFYVDAADDVAEVALLSSLPEGAVRRRIELGNQPYVARLFGRPVAVGWVARELAHIDELGLSFRLPSADRFVWHVEVLGPRRGQDLYAWLLEGIVLHENASRFWIAYPPVDGAAAAGAAEAGFTEVGEISYLAGTGALLEPSGPIECVLAAADTIGVRLAGHDASPERAPPLPKRLSSAA